MFHLKQLKFAQVISKTKQSTWKFSLRCPTQLCKPFVSSVVLTSHWRLWSRNWKCKQCNSVMEQGCQKKWRLPEEVKAAMRYWNCDRKLGGNPEHPAGRKPGLKLIIAWWIWPSCWTWWIGASGARWRWTASTWFEDSFALVWLETLFGRFWFCTSL